MVPLLILTALLLVASGVVKLVAAQRVRIGLPPLALLEVAAGLGLAGVAFVSTFTARQGLLVLVGSVALVIASSLQAGAAVRRHHRRRTASEGARLANYVKHFSRREPPGP